MKTVSDLRRTLAEQLPSFLRTQRWFGGKARQILGVEITDAIPVGETKAFLFLVSVRYSVGAEETYAIPLVPVSQASDGSFHAGSQPISDNGKGAFPFEDAFSRSEFLGELLDIIRRARTLQGEGGRLRGSRTAASSDLLRGDETVQPKLLSGEQSNSSVIYRNRLILKFFRRMEEGENPDLEIGRFLTERARFPHVPRIAGSIGYETRDSKSATQAILQEFVPNQGDAWRYAVTTLTTFYERVGHAPPNVGPTDSENFLKLGGEVMSRLLAEIGLLGKRTAELHLAFSSESDDAAFSPEPFTVRFQETLQRSFAELTGRTLGLLRARREQVPAEYKDKVAEIAAQEPDIVGRFQAALDAPIEAMRTRIHGDYHLGQVLYTGSDFVIIDFEGEPARSLAERRMKQSPLQDVAGMLRSFHYAAFAPLLTAGTDGSYLQSRSKLTSWAEAWSGYAANRFLSQYYETSGRAKYLPKSSQERTKLLETYLLGKAIYELGYELNNRPTWVGIPLEGIARLLSSKG